MAIDPEFLDLMPSTVLWERWSDTEDEWGNNTYADGVYVRCRLEPITVTMQATTSQAGTAIAGVGRQVRIIADLTTPTFTARDKFTLPTGEELRCISAVVQYDENGPYYQEADCQNNQEV